VKHVLSRIKVNLFAIFHPVIAEVLPTALKEGKFKVETGTFPTELPLS